MGKSLDQGSLVDPHRNDSDQGNGHNRGGQAEQEHVAGLSDQDIVSRSLIRMREGSGLS